MTVTVTVQNAERLLRKMRAIPEATKREIKQAMGNEADEIVDLARRLVPKGRTRRLHDSIGWRWGRSKPKGTTELGQVKAPTGFGGELTLTIYAGNNHAFYARWIEFGTVKMAKRPFFFPAYRARRAEAKRVIRAAVRKAAREVAAGATSQAVA
jgi:HK97 gp10 family phage protein